MKIIYRLLLLCISVLLLISSVQAENIWDLEAVNADGTGSHPKVGAAPVSGNKVTVEGIALNSPDELLNTSQMWQIYVQAESPDQGGIAAWAGIFYNSSWPRYPSDIQPGDRIQIEGFVTNHNGKVNINERHSPDPALQFTVTKLESGVGMPAPQQISDLSTCNYFDQTRAGGAEKHQSQWVEFINVHILNGTWDVGESLTVEDAGGTTMTMLLSSEGDFASHTAPAGSFNVKGIFDQEDTLAPYHENYRLWVKNYSDFTILSGINDWEAYALEPEK